MKYHNKLFAIYVETEIPTFKKSYVRGGTAWYQFCTLNCSVCPAQIECKKFLSYPEISKRDKELWEKENPEHTI